MNSFYLVVYYLCFITFIYCNKNDFVLKNRIIEIPYFSIARIFCTSVLFGSNNQNITTKINLSLQFTWISKKVFNVSESNSYSFTKKDTIDLLFFKQEADESTDRFILVNKCTNHHIMNYPFYLGIESKYTMVNLGSIGLAFKFNDTKYSSIHYLYNNKYISNLSFGLYPHDSSNGILFFGGIHEHLLQGMKTSFCTVDDSKFNWNCRLSHIYIGDISLMKSSNAIDKVASFDGYSYFEASENHIYCPKEYITFLIGTVFKNSFAQKQCRYESSSDQFIECKCNIINSFPNVNFVFDGKAYTIKLEHLFLNRNYTDYCALEIIYSSWYKNQWVFGTPFLRNFVSVFDYNNQTVTFYSENDFISFDYFNLFLKKKLIKVLSLVNSSLLSLSLITILSIFYLSPKE